MREEQKKRVLSDKEILRRTWKYLRPHKKSFLFAGIFMLIMVGLQVLGPFLLGKVIGTLKSVDDGTFVGNDPYFTLVYIAVAYFITVLFNSIFIYFSTMILQKAGQKIVYQLREDVFAHIESFSIHQMQEVPVGTLVTRVTSDTAAVNDLFTSILIQMIKNVLLIVSVFTVMFILSWYLSLYMLIFVPLIAIASYLFRRYARKAYREVRSSVSAMNAFLSENLSGMKLTQIFHQEKRKEEEFDEVNQRLKKARKKQNSIFAFFRPFLFLLHISAVALVYLVGMPLVGTTLTIDIIWAFYGYVSQFFNPIQQLADQFNGIQRAFACCERLYLLMDQPPELVNKEDCVSPSSMKGRIEFDHVWFAYKNEDWILKDVSFVVEPGKTTAFVGATGAGKTTILSLIVRNYEIQKGKITIDGIDIRDIEMETLRKSIGQMLQDVFLFSGTIESNITLRDTSISHEEVLKATQYVGADRFIERLPLKYQEPVKEGGSNFSLGQRQLLSFARTLVAKPTILILDEATANIDTETEQLIQESLEKMMKVHTMLIVAHRLSTIQHASNIIVLRHGEIIEQGNHQQLLKKKGYYYHLYRLQFEKREDME